MFGFFPTFLQFEIYQTRWKTEVLLLFMTLHSQFHRYTPCEMETRLSAAERQQRDADSEEELHVYRQHEKEFS